LRSTRLQDHGRSLTVDQVRERDAHGHQVPQAVRHLRSARLQDHGRSLTVAQVFKTITSISVLSFRNSLRHANIFLGHHLHHIDHPREV
jgi:hypothetical protein